MSLDGSNLGTSLVPYVPRLVLEWDEIVPGARHHARDGTMVFADVSGFTNIAERLAGLGKLGAEELTQHVDAIFSALLAEASRFGGSFLKFGGDALLIFFSGEGHARRACAAAWAMRASLRRMSRISTSSGWIRLRMSTAVHTGSFDFFLVGNSHSELVVGGTDADSVAALESAASPGEVLLSPQIAEYLPGSVVGVAKQGAFYLKRPPSAPQAGEGPMVQADPSRYVPALLRDYVIAGEGAEHRLVAVGFLRFGAITALIESEGPLEAGDRLHAFVTEVQASFEEQEVSFLSSDISLGGGKVLAAAGAPTTSEDDGGRMLRALARVKAIDHGLPLRAGVHGGHVFAGPVGTTTCRTYTVMGDVVNTAARLTSHAQSGQLLATTEVLRAARTLFAVDELPAFIAKGKRSAVVPFLVHRPMVNQRSGKSEVWRSGVYVSLLLTYLHLEEPTAEAVGTRALMLFEETGDVEGKARVLNDLGTLAQSQGRWTEALTRYRDAGELMATVGYDVLVNMTARSAVTLSDEKLGAQRLSSGPLTAAAENHRSIRAGLLSDLHVRTIER